MPSPTVKQFASALDFDWDGVTLDQADKSFAKWIWWPADVFAFVAAVFKKTGVHRCIVPGSLGYDVPENFAQDAEHVGEIWQSEVEAALNPEEGVSTETWAKLAADLESGMLGESQEYVDALRNQTVQRERYRTPEHLKAFGEFVDALRCVQSFWHKVALNDLQLLDDPLCRTDPDQPSKEATALFKALHLIFACADCSAAGFGMLNHSTRRSGLVIYYANSLLNLTGSLSHFPKVSGIVVPKLLTPGRGLTARSVSHHLFFTETEIQVIWRNIPWPDLRERAMNVLTVHWPPVVNTEHFEASADIPNEAGTFEYVPPQWSGEPDDADFDLVPLEASTEAEREAHETAKREQDVARRVQAQRVVDLVEKAQRENGPIQILAMPECALSRSDYICLQEELRNRYLSSGEEANPFVVPILMCGVRDKWPAKGKLADYDLKSQLSFNVAMTGMYLADKWYDLSQFKHHRWLLDESQLRQYKLAGRFTASKLWYEKMDLVQRRLTVLAPTGWLAVTPLICEDLARQEPAADLVRGIGPSLVMALLMDGPQISGRWPSLYATVLADDPGSSVLSITSKGMVGLSKPLNGGTPSHSLALWKQRGGVTHSYPGECGECDALLFSFSADRRREITVDGRSDHGYAYTLSLLSCREYSVPEARAYQPARHEAKPWTGYWSDIQDLAQATIAIDASIVYNGSNPEYRRIRSNIRRALVPSKEWATEAAGDLKNLAGPFAEYMRILISTVNEPVTKRNRRAGTIRYIEENDRQPEIDLSLLRGSDAIQTLFNESNGWEAIAHNAEKRLASIREKAKDGSVDRGEPLFMILTLTLLHSRLRGIMGSTINDRWDPQWLEMTGIQSKQKAKALLKKLDAQLKDLPRIPMKEGDR
ncbi:MAG: hypothetical protein ACO1SV_18880 [Fimbriimonas sp.]